MYAEKGYWGFEERGYWEHGEVTNMLIKKRNIQNYLKFKFHLCTYTMCEILSSFKIKSI